MTTLHDLAREIVDALSANAWTYQPPRNPDQSHYAIIERCDGLRICLLRYESDKRITLRPEALEAPDENGNRMTYDYDLPKITVAATRTPASIAADIRSRLLPDAESWYRVALHWQQNAIATHARLAELRRQLLDFPDTRSSSFSRKLYGDGWTCEPRSGRSILTFELTPDLIVKVLTAYHQVIEEPMNDHTQPGQQQSMFPAGDDLPLFSGAPVAVVARRFDPKPEPDQPAMLDLRPAFGGAEPAYSPELEADN